MRFILFLIPVVIAFSQESPVQAVDVLKRLDAKVRGAQQYIFEGSLTLHGQNNGAETRQLSQAKVRFAVAQPGMSFLRVEPLAKDEYLLVSDGKKSWAYVPRLKQYTETDSVSIAGDDDDEDGGDNERDPAEMMAHQVMPLLQKIMDTIQAADVSGTASVNYEGKKRKWPVVRAMSKKDAREGQSLTELAIDPATLSIRRLVWTNATYSKSGAKSVLRLGLDFSTFRIGEDLAADTFTFEPPKKAKLVDSLPIPGQTGSFLLDKPAPDFELKTLEGERVRLADFKGKPVLLNFWASWCGPCRHELPGLANIYDAYKSKGLIVLGVNDEGKGDARKFADKAGLSFPTLDDSSLKAHRLYRIRSIPSVFLIDRDGKVVKFFKGAKDEAELRTALKSVGL